MKIASIFFFFLTFCHPFPEKTDVMRDLGTLSFEEKSAESFRRIDPSALALEMGFRTEPVDFPLHISGLKPGDSEVYLVFLWSLLDSVEVCQDSQPCEKAGFSIPMLSWPVNSLFPVFPIKTGGEGDHLIRVRIDSKNHLNCELRLFRADKLFAFTIIYSGIWFAFFSLILIQIIMQIASFLHLRSEWILYQIFFSIGFAFMLLIVSGLGSNYFFPSFGLPLSLMKKILVGYLLITGTKWISSYLETKKKHPYLNFFFLVIQFLSFLFLIFSFTSFPRMIISIAYAIFYLSVTITSILLGILAIQRREMQTAWFVLSMFTYLVVEILNIFTYLSFDLYDCNVFLITLAITMPANILLLRQAEKSKMNELRKELVLRRENNLKERKSIITNLQKDDVVQRIEHLFEKEKIFKEERLRLGDLAFELGLSSHQLSEFLNQVLKTSFPELLKKYRIEEAKALMLQNKETNIVEIAFAVGFNSKSSFNESFKAYTGMTPQEFRKKNGS